MNWERIRLGSLITIKKGKKHTSLNASLHRYINIEDLHNPNNIVFTDERGCLVDESDLIIAWDGANAGKVGIGYRGVIGSTLAKLTITSKILVPRFLFWVLESINPLIKSQRTGATIPHINGSALKDLQIPLPPIPTQKRIVAILDAADALKRKDQELLKKYDELAQAIFIDMFGDPVRNEKGWETGKIRDLAKEVKYGTSKPASEEGTFPYLRMNNITYTGEWDFSKLKYINLTGDELRKYVLAPRDLVFNRTNSKELVGKTAVFDSAEQMAIAGYLIRLRTNEYGNPYYISSYLNSIHGKKTLLGMCKSIVGMANINAQELQQIKILIPPIEIQNEFEGILKAIKGIRLKTETQILKSDSLFNYLIQKAFNGELIA